MYNYYYVKTDCHSNIWDTAEIQRFLRSLNMFEEKQNGIFSSQDPFINISLMKVKELNSWSSLDFNKDGTNYFSIVTSELSDSNVRVKDLFIQLEQLLCSGICPDNCQIETQG